uniref:Uncharacterized protein LOC111117764 isoform X1 n=1 Tax=Crassostrea virginica TaxID=6565 RepID=A0A8B8CAN6_CRAVI|nr:uncharacterized protein LOC111117764 isoform X1 [Crassostrea virginica]
MFRGTLARGVNFGGDPNTGGVHSQLPAEPHQDGEGHGGAQVVHGERDPRGPPHHQTRSYTRNEGRYRTPQEPHKGYCRLKPGTRKLCPYLGSSRTNPGKGKERPGKRLKSRSFCLITIATTSTRDSTPWSPRTRIHKCRSASGSEGSYPVQN